MTFFSIILLAWLTPALLLGACMLWIVARAPKRDYRSQPAALNVTEPSVVQSVEMPVTAASDAPCLADSTDDESNDRPALIQLARG
jgi:hypothetical protein